jgi:hypothetical protein
LSRGQFEAHACDGREYWSLQLHDANVLCTRTLTSLVVALHTLQQLPHELQGFSPFVSPTDGHSQVAGSPVTLRQWTALRWYDLMCTIQNCSAHRVGSHMRIVQTRLNQICAQFRPVIVVPICTLCSIEFDLSELVTECDWVQAWEQLRQRMPSPHSQIPQADQLGWLQDIQQRVPRCSLVIVTKCVSSFVAFPVQSADTLNWSVVTHSATHPSQYAVSLLAIRLAALDAFKRRPVDFASHWCQRLSRQTGLLDAAMFVRAYGLQTFDGLSLDWIE